MNENMRILLLALGIMAIVATGPPVADFGHPRSVCSIARNLAVSAFESLVRSTLPLSSEQPEGERSAEVLVRGVGESETPPSRQQMSGSTPALVSNKSAAAAFISGNAGREISSPEIVRSACAASNEREKMLPVDAAIRVKGLPVQEPG